VKKRRSNGSGVASTAHQLGFLTSREVAHLLDCSPNDVIALIRRGTLKAEKGTHWKYRLEDVMAFKKKCRENKRK
jgi:excisionase family DNA binding protein